MEKLDNNYPENLIEKNSNKFGIEDLIYTPIKPKPLCYNNALFNMNINLNFAKLETEKTKTYETESNLLGSVANSENYCTMIIYRSNRLASFYVKGRKLICLPQAYELILKDYVGGLHTIYTKLKRLGITPNVCNVEQVRVLRGLGAIQPGVNRCKLISPDEFDVLYDDCTCISARPGRPAKRADHSSNLDNKNNKVNDYLIKCNAYYNYYKSLFPKVDDKFSPNFQYKNYPNLYLPNYNKNNWNQTINHSYLFSKKPKIDMNTRDDTCDILKEAPIKLLGQYVNNLVNGKDAENLSESNLRNVKMINVANYLESLLKVVSENLNKLNDN